MTILYLKGFSGRKSLGEHLNILANIRTGLALPTLYFSIQTRSSFLSHGAPQTVTAICEETVQA
jgi:hypothetical protein